jgi:uncharacterized membrane protein SpoIIM required for sporulation
MSAETSSNAPLPGVFSRENLRGFFGKRRIVLISAIFMIQAASYFIIPSLPFGPGEEQQYTSQSKQLAGLIAGNSPLELFVLIFFHNLVIALILVLPAAGILQFSSVTYATARTIQAIAVSASPQPLPPIAVSMVLFFFPHTWIELVAYPVAVAESLLLIFYALKVIVHLVRKKENIDTETSLRLEIRYTVLTVVAVIVTLLVGAIFETVEIATVPYEFLSWLPFLAVVGVFVYWLRKVTRSPASPTATL